MKPLSDGESPVITVRVPAEIKDALKERARQYHRSYSEFIRIALDVSLGKRCCIGSLGGDPFSCQHGRWEGLPEECRKSPSSTTCEHEKGISE